MPNFEDPIKNDFNVTIAVEQVEQSEDSEDVELRSTTQYYIKVKDNNDLPILNPDAKALSIDEIIDESLTGPYTGGGLVMTKAHGFWIIYLSMKMKMLWHIIELSPQYLGEPSLQDHLFVQNGQLFFSSSKAPNYEMFENGVGQVMIRAFDGRSSIYELLTNFY